MNTAYAKDFLLQIFGVQDHLSTVQEGARAILIFAYGLLLLRLSGPRLFGRWSALDVVISIMVGSALARAMTGGAPLVGTMVAAAVMAFLHVILAHIVARSRGLALVFEGKPVVLVDHGRIDHRTRKRNKISEADLLEALRQEGIDGKPPYTGQPYFLDGLTAPGGLIFDSDGNLYASTNGSTPAVVRYNSNHLKSGDLPSIVDSAGLAATTYEASFAFTANGDLYAANCGNNGTAGIQVWPLGTKKFNSHLKPSVSYTNKKIQSDGCAWGIAIE